MDSPLAEAKQAEMSDSQDAFKAALTQTGILVGAALAFCAGVFLVQGQEPATAWFAAYILEESLSIDNLFVFSLIFSYFQTPTAAQPKVLRYGLLAAIALRGAPEALPSPPAGGEWARGACGPGACGRCGVREGLA